MGGEVLQDIEKSFSFLRDIIREIPDRYHSNEKRIKELEKEQQDLLHAIELVNFNAYQGFKLSKKVKEVRKERRELKNENELLELITPLLKRYRSDLQNMDLLLGKLRERKNNQNLRGYRCRVREELQEDIDSGRFVNF